MALNPALKLGYAYEENKKYTLELRRDFTQNSEIDQINRFRKPYKSRDRNPNPEVILKYKFCSGTHNKGSCQAYGKICNNCGSNGHFAKCCAKKKAIHLLNQEYSDYTAHDDSFSDYEDFPDGTINVENLNPSDNDDIILKIQIIEIHLQNVFQIIQTTKFLMVI